jgi:predicted Rossmann-fold nucleotide-binding protein
MKPFPVILYDSEYWRGFLEWLRVTVLAAGAISPEDFELLRVFDSPEDVTNAVISWYTRQELMGTKALD